MLDERYRLDALVATGGMGEVWRATDVTLGRLVAVKLLHPALLADRQFDARFEVEARIMAALTRAIGQAVQAELGRVVLSRFLPESVLKNAEANPLALLEPRARKLAGAIAGRALYDGRLDPAAALALIRTARAAA